ncbi:MAG: very short patch repair endonuclease [Actinomycetota bacterium]|nr:very short patch repair endonuclease [Actinomycetota bacterium]
MRRNRSADTQLEVTVRSGLHRSGLRFRKGLRVTTGTLSVRPDVVFPRARVAVFLDGCFWHGCPDHGTQPRANATYWSQKLARNAARDQRVVDELEGAGWVVLRFWEHELAERIVAEVVSAVHGRSQLSARASPASR